jgi:uncharacterized protein (TIGR00730 family)
MPKFILYPTALGKALAETDRALVYGGGSMGLMGVVSATTLEQGGEVLGVRPRAMLAAGGEGRGPKELSNDAEKSSRMTTFVVESMHERKMMMAKLAGAGFIALPGGFGTFEEVRICRDNENMHV